MNMLVGPSTWDDGIMEIFTTSSTLPEGGKAVHSNAEGGTGRSLGSCASTIENLETVLLRGCCGCYGPEVVMISSRVVAIV